MVIPYHIVSTESIHTSNIIQVIFGNIYVYTHTHAITMKKDVNLKRARRGIWKDLEGREGRDKCCNCIIISKQ